jgi:hypothetical protein
VARTPEGAALTRRHRLAQLAIRAAAIRSLLQLWPIFRATDFATFDTFAGAAATLAIARRNDSAGLAARYLEAFRFAEGVGGRVTPRLADPLPIAAARDTLRANALMGVLNGRRAGQSIQAAQQNGLVRATGTVSSLVLGGGRDTIMGSLERDRQALGWQRITGSDPCAFCRMIASRGPVFSKDTAGFEAHGHDACEPEPVYEGSEMPAQSRRFRDEFDQAQREARGAGELRRGTGNDALNAYRRFLSRTEAPAPTGE